MNTPNEIAPVENSSDPSLLLQEIKNEKGEQKYSDVSVALKSLKDSQDYIASLKAELEAEKQRHVSELGNYQEELAKRKPLEDLLAELKSTKITEQAPVSIPNQSPVTTGQKEGDMTTEQQATIFDEATLKALVQKEIQQLQASTKAEQTLSKSMSLVESLRGESTVETYLEEKAKNVGLSMEALLSIAGSSPEAFGKLVGAKITSPSFPLGSHGRVSSTQLDIDPKPDSSMLYGASDASRVEYAAKLRKIAENKLGVNR